MILANATVFDVTTAQLAGPLHVVVDGSSIKEVTPELPPDSFRGHELVDCTGKFVIPGLVDAHTHIDWSDPDVTNPDDQRIELDYYVRSFLFHGVTTVVNMSAHNPERVLAIRDEVKARPTALLPRIFTGTSHFTVPNGWGARHGGALDSLDQIAARVAADKDRGVDLIKIIDEDGLDHQGRLPKIDRAAMHQIASAAAAADLPVFVHATGRESYEDCLAIRPQVIAHGLLDDLGGNSDELVGRLVAMGCSIVPTITVFELMMNPGYWPPTNDELYDASVPDFIDALRRRPGRAQAQEEIRRKRGVGFWNEGALENVKANTRLFADAGIPLATGTDRGEGYYLPGELRLMATEIGARATLVAATAGGARAIGREHEFGAVAPGLSADLLILNADPLRDIGNVRDFDALVLRGRVVERQALSYKAFMAEERTGTQ